MTSIESFTDQELVDRVLDWASEKKGFDASFVMDLDEAIAEWGQLTSAQREGLENVALKWRIFG